MSSTGNSKVRTLERAVAAFGGANNLAAYLNVTSSELDDWSSGRVEIPPVIFAAALDVVAAGPFVRWSENHDSEKAQRHQAHADRLQEIADRIKASAERAQRIADQAKHTADRSVDLVRVQRVLADSRSPQDSDRPTEQPADK